MISPILALSLFTALSTVSALPTPAADPHFDDILSLSPRELLPAYLEERDVPNYPSPRPLNNLIAYFPKITSPSENSSWKAGAPLTLAWNNTKPAYEENQIHKYATVYLGYRNPADPSSGLNLDIERPLANLSLYDAPDPVSIILPTDLETRSTYLLVLGSTSNMSPQFTINAIEDEDITSSESESQAPATQAVVASPSSSSSSNDDDEPLSTRVATQTSSSSSTTARVAAKTQAAEATSSPQNSDDSQEDSSSPSPAASSSAPNEANTPVAVAPSSSATRSPSTPITASGGALAASSQTPTSAASSQFTLSSLLVASIVAIVAISI